MNEIVVAILGFAGTLAGSLLGVLAAQKLTQYRLSQLEEKVNKHNNLRGCIGYPEPVYPLLDAVIDSAISAAIRDPRFPSVDESELDILDYEITVLTKPRLIEVEKPIEYLDNIIIGEDGLIVERGFYRGLLLPQVAPEHNMDKEEFLSHTCMKAGLRPDAWLDENTKVYKFQGQIFK